MASKQSWTDSYTFSDSNFIQSANISTAINGFKKSGAWPVDMNVFTEIDFLPADPTDIALSVNQEIEDCIQYAPEEGNYVETLNITDPVTIQPDKPIDQPGTFTDYKDSSFAICSSKILQPLPKISQNKKRVNRNRGKTAILTSSPYKAQLEAEVSGNKFCSKQLKSTECIQKKRMRKKSSIGKETEKKKRICKKENKSNNASKGGTSDDVECLYYNELYSMSNEGWISYAMCFKWAHNSCAGVDENDENHICVFCS